MEDGFKNAEAALDNRSYLVRDTVAVLKQLCTAPRYIAQVRRELAVQGVTPKIGRRR